MNGIELLILVLLGAVLVVVVYSLFFRNGTQAQKDERSEGLLMLQKQLQNLERTMDQRLGESNKAIQESVRAQLSESTKIVKEVTEGLTKLGETNKQVIGFAEQLKQLQDVLKNPKQRGVLGEYYLESVLQNVLPPEGFKMQYGFENGEIVDAVVFVKDKIIPVDSKFSLENYNRYIEAKDPSEKAQLAKVFENDLKLRIKETAKYIRPAEKTTDFAFMFIPSEGIYYELLTNTIGEESLIQRAAGTYKVIVVSPTSFLAYLQTVLQGLKALEIEERALDIIKNVEKLGTHIAKYEDYYKKLGKTLETTVNHYNAGYKELGKVDKDVMKITGSNAGVDQLVLDKPRQED
ncbi:DNA recombination protein RmuC [Candidatus Kaiserbacteria bacterium]|nr:DNA recombination protein RmuC [Candidatus Kaiserbacteria bacterium]